MQFKQAMVPVGSIFDAQSGVCFTDTTETIKKALNKSEIERYGRAMLKVQQGQGLNRQDLAVLDKIDQATFDKHGMCLKDSAVTKARIKACKKHGLKFVDRDGLVEHMNAMNPNYASPEYSQEYCESILEIFQEKLGNDVHIKLMQVIAKIEHKLDFDLDDLNFLSKLEIVADKELGWTIINDEIKAAIEKASNSLGVYFQNLQKVVTH